MQIFERYERQTSLPEIGTEGQERLMKSRVLVVGIGGLGCPAALYLTAAGIGTLGLVDNDIISLNNLQRQILYSETEVGQPKVLFAARHLREINKNVHIEIHPYRLDKRNATDLIKGYDIVVDGCDNFTTRYILSDACKKLGIPYVYGAINGFEGQVSVFYYGASPRTYRELYPQEEELCGLHPERAVMGVVAGMTACAQVTEVLKIIVGFGEVLSGRLWVMDLRTMASNIINF